MKNSSSESAASAAAHRVESFVYRDSGLPAPEPGDLAWYGEPEPALPAGISEEQAQAREARARAEASHATRLAVWEEARQRTELDLRAALDLRLQQERDAIHHALLQFAEQRQQYFHQLEREMVQLSLAIARKVLQREAQIDPLLLAGTVRVALDQLAGGATVTLRVPPSQLALWEARLRGDAGLKFPPRLHPDPALEPAGCRLEADTGSSDLSLDSQLGEIEQGFLDLLRRRPNPVAAGVAVAVAP